MVKEHMPSPFGHALAGVAAAWTADLLPGRREGRVAASTASWFSRAGGGLTAICLGLAVVPDVDLAFQAHRSWTHSVTAVAIVTIIAAGVTAWVTRRPAWRVALTCGGAYATHLVLDWLAADTFLPYGIQVLWPFSHAWYISGLDLFPPTGRQNLLSERTIRINAIAMATEAVALLPIVVGLWLVRVKALAGLASKLPGRDHSPQ